MWSDLLFFNRELNALVAIELKVGKFKPSYLGQLYAYLQVLDDKVRKPHENPSIGIVLCKSANQAYAEYAVRDYKVLDTVEGEDEVKRDAVIFAQKEIEAELPLPACRTTTPKRCRLNVSF